MAEQVTTQMTPTEEHAEHARRRLVERGRTLVTDATKALQKPGVGGTAAGVAVLAAAATWGVSEALVASAVAYGVFRTLKKRRAARAASSESSEATGASSHLA